MGETPHRLAKEASLLNLWRLSPATISSVAAWSVPMPGKQTNLPARLFLVQAHLAPGLDQRRFYRRVSVL